MKPLTVLRRARALITLPKNWTQDAYARNKRALPVSQEDPTACRWCAIGAISKVTRTAKNAAVCYSARNAAAQFFSDAAGQHVVAFNDAATTKHADVLAVFDKAIALAKAAA